MNPLFSSKDKCETGSFTRSAYFPSQLTEFPTFKRLDADNDGGITAKEFEVALQDAALISVFDALEISVEDAWALFRTLDSDGDSHVGPQEFVDGCLRCKGPARAIDVVCIKRDLHTVLHRLEGQAMEVAAMKKHFTKRP